MPMRHVEQLHVAFWQNDYQSGGWVPHVPTRWNQALGLQSLRWPQSLTWLRAAGGRLASLNFCFYQQPAAAAVPRCQ